jgi:hypothetical protein
MYGGKMNRYKEFYRVEQLPVFKNRMFYSIKDARKCTRGDVVLVKVLETGLIFNQVFQPKSMEYYFDINPSQQGKYIAGTGIKISSSSQAIDTIPIGSDVFVINGNYLAEINDIVQDRLNLIAVD